MVSGRFISERRSRVVRPVTYTVMPSRPSSTAMARPAARDPPATSATLSSVMPTPCRENLTSTGPDFLREITQRQHGFRSSQYETVSGRLFSYAA
jgi:hypothetical protein